MNYESVRRAGGRCLAVFLDQAIRFQKVEFGAVVLEWDGAVSRRIAQPQRGFQPPPAAAAGPCDVAAQAA